MAPPVEEGLLTEDELAELKKDTGYVETVLQQQEKDEETMKNYTFHQQRLVFLNESVKERMRMQNDMLWIVFIVIVICLLFALLYQYVPFLFPYSVYTVLELCVIGVGAMIVLFKYRDYVRRDSMDFNQLSLQGPAGAGEEKTSYEDKLKANAAAAGNLSKSIQMAQCIGKECCATGTKFDSVSATCVPSS